MPAPVAADVMRILADLEEVLLERAPGVLGVLNPGLSEKGMAELEARFDLRLPPDLRALYGWRNGQAGDTVIYLVPGHRFMPLEEALIERDHLKEAIRASRLVDRGVYAVVAGHRKGWVPVFDDFAGDGYFWDIRRGEKPGHFFYNMSEMTYYFYFPSVRDFLAGIVEGYTSGAIWLGVEEETTQEDFEATERIWTRYGVANE
jgi:cell wall assembly regulator SMI1